MRWRFELVDGIKYQQGARNDRESVLFVRNRNHGDCKSKIEAGLADVIIAGGTELCRQLRWEDGVVPNAKLQRFTPIGIGDGKYS